MDFQKIVQDLIGRGYSQVELAELCGCAQSSISDISRGVIKSPSYAIGQRLVDLSKAKQAKRKAVA